jgi:uncharacterized membrane protein
MSSKYQSQVLSRKEDKMTLDPFFNAPFAIQIHMIAAFGAFFLGAAVLWKRKGGKIHKLNGRIWVALMMVTAFSGFFIHEIRMWGNFSPIHIFSVVTPISLVYAIYAIRKGNMSEHINTMKATYIGGMVFAGGFTFLPGRINHEIFFGDADWNGIPMSWVLVLLFAGAILIALYFSPNKAAAQNNNSKPSGQ